MVYTFDVVIESVVIEIYDELLGTWFTSLFVNLGDNFKSGSWLIESYKFYRDYTKVLCLKIV